MVKHNQNKKTQLRILDVLDSKTEPSITNGVESQTPTLGCKKTFETSLPAETSIQSQQYPVTFNFPLCTNLNSNLGSNLVLPLAEPAKQSSRLCAEIQEGNVLPRTVQNSNGTAAARFLEPVLPFALCPEKVRAPAASPSTANSLGVIKKSLTILGNVAEANKSQFTFRPIFKPPNKPFNFKSQATQDKPVNVEILFEGLDEELLFGDY